MKQYSMISIICSLLLLVAGMTGCSSDENDKDIADLCETSWRLYGFGTSANMLQKAEPSECSTCYVIKFEPDGSFTGRTTSNEISGSYSISSNSFKIVNCLMTYVGEVGDGNKYIDAFRSSVRWEITEDRHLKLYYNEQNDFLLFNPQE